MCLVALPIRTSMSESGGTRASRAWYRKLAVLALLLYPLAWASFLLALEQWGPATWGSAWLTGAVLLNGPGMAAIQRGSYPWLAIPVSFLFYAPFLAFGGYLVDRLRGFSRRDASPLPRRGVLLAIAGVIALVLGAHVADQSGTPARGNGRLSR